MLLSLDYLTSLFYYIPKSALAAVIIMAVAPLFDARIVRTLWRVARAYAPSVERLLVRPPPSSRSLAGRLEPGGWPGSGSHRCRMQSGLPGRGLASAPRPCGAPWTRSTGCRQVCTSQRAGASWARRSPGSSAQAGRDFVPLARHGAGVACQQCQPLGLQVEVPCGVPGAVTPLPIA